MSVAILHDRFLDMSAPYWRDNIDMSGILYSYAAELQAQGAKIDDTLYNEFFTETASDWGLRLKEELYSLYDGIERTLEERRGRIRAFEAGGNVVTIADLERIAGSFVGGTVKITIDYDAFRVNIDFIDQRGVPSRIADVEAALSRALPGYYEIFFNYKFNSYRDIKLYFDTYQAIKDTRLTYFQLLQTDQQIPSYIDIKGMLSLELTRYVSESKSIMLGTSYSGYSGLN